MGFRAALYLLTLSFSLLGCGGSGSKSDEETASIVSGESDRATEIEEAIELIGAVQKGPFIVGSLVTINHLNDFGENTEKTIVTSTNDDMGSFRFSTRERGLLQVSATGIYRNEISGGLSQNPLTLRSVAQIIDTNGNTATFVNLLTHITNKRILSLVTTNELSFDVARIQAEREFLTAFETILVPKELRSFTGLSIFSGVGHEGSSYLLAFSAIVYQYAILLSEERSTNPDSELSLIINTLESDFNDNGQIDNNATLMGLKTAIPLVDPETVTDNVNEWVGSQSGYISTDINLLLDTDLDGVVNSEDTDDDNDGIPDNTDEYPYVKNFSTLDIALETDEDTALEIDLAINEPTAGAVETFITQLPNNGTLSGTYPTYLYIPNPDFYGVDQIKYTVSQADLVSEEVTIDIIIKPINDHPVISGVPQTEVTALNEYSFLPTILNMDNDQLTFSVESLPDWLDFNTMTGRLRGIPNNEHIGRYEDIVISVFDGVESVELEPFTIDVVGHPWMSLAPLPQGVKSPAVVATDSGILVFGGQIQVGAAGTVLSNRVTEYDTVLESWTLKRDLPYAVTTNAAVINGKVYLAGGFVIERVEAPSISLGGAPYPIRVTTRELLIYDIEMDSWSSGTSMHGERASHASCVFNEKIYVFGGRYIDLDRETGYSKHPSLSSVEMYDPDTEEWIAKAAMPEPNMNMACVTFKDNIYLFGGESNSNGYWIYDPVMDMWSDGGLLNTPRKSGMAAAVVNDEIFLLGGNINFAQGSDAVESLNPETGVWTQKTPMPHARSSMGYAAYDDRIYMIGGDGGIDVNGGIFATDLVQVYDVQLDD